MRLRSRPATLVSLATLAAAASLAAPAAAQTAPEAETAAVPAVEIVASYPSGTFLENLLVDGDRVLFTSYLDRRLMAWDGEGEPSVLAGLDTHPVGLASVGDRIVASAHGAPFTEGPTFTATNRFLVLDRDGAVISETPAPDALFLNGLVALPSGAVLAADSLAGRIWRFDPASGAIETWLEDEALRPVEGSPRPGANGLKLAGDALLVSNSARGALLRVPLDGEAPAGPPETVAETGPIDDFAVLADGTVIAASHGEDVLRIAPDGAVAPLLEGACDGCTAVAAYGSEGDLLVLTTGSLLEGGTEDARVLRLAPRG